MRRDESAVCTQGPSELAKSPARFARTLLLALVLLAFARVTWRLGDRHLWWDESLTLQRAESSWGALLRGALPIRDGVVEVMSFDQHPFFFFLIEGVLVRLAGVDEFVLRFPAAAAATLLVPTVWALGRRLSSPHKKARGALPGSTAWWAAGLAALSPFFLRYGQEARPYTLLAALGLVSTYCLVRALPLPNDMGNVHDESTSQPDPPANGPSPRWGAAGRGWRVGYLLTLAAFLTTHYYAVLLLPVHALLIGAGALAVNLTRRSRRRILAAALTVLGLGALIGGGAAWSILARGGGSNFFSTPPFILLRDILNALSLGPRADVGNSWLWALDLLFAMVASWGAVWGLRQRKFLVRGGWLPLAMVALPVAALLMVGLVRPAYMNARHLAVIGGGWLLGLGAGLGALWRWRRPFTRIATVALATLLFGGSLYGNWRLHATTFAQGAARADCVGCTVDNDDFSSLAEHLRDRLLPGDLVLLDPPFARPLFEYYLPLTLVDEADIYAVPMLDFPKGNADWSDTRDLVDAQRLTHPRAWRIESDTYGFMDPDDRVQEILHERLFLIQEIQFDSDSALRAELYLAEPPVYNKPVDVAARGGRPVNVVFGDAQSSGLRLLGYDIDAPLTTSSALPVTLYWQKITPSGEQDGTRLKYVLRLEEALPNGEVKLLAQAEREPYEGFASISMDLWHPDQTIIEYAALPPESSDGNEVDWGSVDWSRTQMTLSVYDPASLVGLPVAEVVGEGVESAGGGVRLPAGGLVNEP